MNVFFNISKIHALSYLNGTNILKYSRVNFKRFLC